MLVTLPVCVIGYAAAVIYLNHRYKEEEENFLKALLPQRKRNIALLLIYLFAGVVGGIVFVAYGYSHLEIIRNLLIILFSWILAYIDRRERIVPNHLVVMILLVASLFLILRISGNFPLAFGYVLTSLTGMLFGGGIFLISRVFSKKGVGMGDIKLLAAMGFYLGLYSIVGVLMIALFVVSGTGLYLIFIKKRSIKDELPFAPFIAIGVTVGILLGF